MSAYFGNGYFLNILQRGARPVGNAHSKPPYAPVRFEETVATTANQSSEVSSEKFEVQNRSLDHPASIATQPLKDDPLTESTSFKEPEPIQVTTRFRSHETPETPSGTITHQAPAALDTQSQESNATLRSSESSSLQVLSSPPIGSSVHTGPDEPVSSGEELLQVRSTSRVFELRMPENFFGHAKGETFSTDQVKPLLQSRIVSAPLDPQAESKPTVDHSSGAAVPASTVIIPKHQGEISELQINELTPPGPITDSLLTPQPATVVSEVMDHVKQNNAQLSKLIPAQAFESSAPTPKVEQTSEYLQLRQPLIAPAPVVQPARLQINRLDIQVVNQAPAPPPPPARAPDVSQLLEKHLGRVELLL